MLMKRKRPGSSPFIAAWHAEHMEFLRLLDLLEKQIAMFHFGERPDYELMLDIIRYLGNSPAELHHAREDAAFSRLAGAYPGVELVFARLHQEHRVIANAGRALFELLEAALAGTMIARGKIEAAADTYLLYYRTHIRVEETEVLPRAAKALGAGDWAAIAATLPAAADPRQADAARAK
jgi:hemerythrin-like domain-containing protein